MPIPRLDVFDELFDKDRLQFFRSHLCIKSHDVGRLRPGPNLSVIFDICSLEARANVVYKFRVALCVCFLPHGVRHFGHHVCKQRPIRGSQKVLIGMLVRRKPVCEIGAHSFFSEEIRIAAKDEFHPVLHAIPVSFDKVLVSVLYPGGPRNNDAGIAPARSAHHVLSAGRCHLRV